MDPVLNNRMRIWSTFQAYLRSAPSTSSDTLSDESWSEDDRSQPDSGETDTTTPVEENVPAPQADTKPEPVDPPASDSLPEPSLPRYLVYPVYTVPTTTSPATQTGLCLPKTEEILVTSTYEQIPLETPIASSPPNDTTPRTFTVHAHPWYDAVVPPEPAAIGPKTIIIKIRVVLFILGIFVYIALRVLCAAFRRVRRAWRRRHEAYEDHVAEDHGRDVGRDAGLQPMLNPHLNRW
ncbi:hypothetical protein EVJ58_g8198 [Rhodofomes roseus]|uniref:Uncharacterized protein n=1 Tax=Rhodofomes roseus TaxID=34475 RepID=A0A4Y9Y2B9_9APHY|nr:hypothetical protein EVJ58_g8198 [Rhodofomes roseus]